MARGARPVCLVALVLALVPARGVVAQQVCRDAETVNDCWIRLAGLSEAAQAEQDQRDEETAAEVRQEALFAEAARLFGKATGVPALQTPALNSAIDDFLSRYAGSITRLGEEDEDIGFGFEATFPFHSGSGFTPIDVGGDVRLRLMARKAKVHPSLLESIADSVRDQIGMALAEPLDDADDLTIEVGWNRESDRFGRSFSQRLSMLDALLGDIIDRAKASVPGPDQRFLQFIQMHETVMEDSVGPANRAACLAAIRSGSFDNVRMDCFVPTFRDRFEAELLRNATARRDVEAAIRMGLEGSGFHRIAQLINNQPQVSVSAYTTLRDAVVGPTAYGIRFRAEKGFANLNALRGDCPDGRITAPCLQAFLGNAGVRSALATGDRLWASLDIDYTEAHEYENADTAVPVQYAADETWSLSLTGGYGRYLGVDAQGVEQARFDAALEVELSSGDPLRQNRIVGLLTYTHKLNDSVVIPLGVTLANKAKYAGGSGDGFLLNVGFRFDLQPDVPAPGGS